MPTLGDMHVEAAGRNDLSTRWYWGIVPFYRVQSGDGALTPLASANLDTAMKNIEARTPIHFMEYTSLDLLSLPSGSDIVRIEQDVYAKSVHVDSIGRKGGEQKLTLGNFGGDTVLEVTHGLALTLGLRGEQQRKERNTVLNVCPSNADGNEYDVKTDIDRLTPYDLHSVTHYFQDEARTASPSLSLCGGHTMTQLNPANGTFPAMGSAGGCGTCSTVSATCLVDCHYIGRSGKLTEQLSAEDINALTLMYGGPLGHPTTDAAYGTAMVVADFDNDGRSDMIVSAPGEGTMGGAVYAYKGTFRGMAPWKELTTSDGIKPKDDFGHALAVGDFNGDGIPDVAIGAPGKAIGTNAAAGTVTIYYGGRFAGSIVAPDCPTNPVCQARGFPVLKQRFTLSPRDISGITNIAGDRFGTSLAVADFDHDGFDDLVVGAPGMAGNNGRVYVYSGKKLETGSTSTGGPSQPAIMLGPGTKGGFGQFGAAVATGDLDGSGTADIAVGAPLDGGTGHVSVFQPLSITSFIERSFVSPPFPMVKDDGFGDTLLIARVATKVAGAVLAPRLIVGSPHSSLGGRVDIMSFTTTTSLWTPHSVQGMGGSGQYGFALAALDIDKDGFDDLFVGGPTRHATASDPAGHVEMWRTNGASVASMGFLLPLTGNLPAKFGASFAVGDVQGDEVFPATPMKGRLLIGAPAVTTTLPTFGMNAGSAYAWAFDPVTGNGETRAFDAGLRTIYAAP